VVTARSLGRKPKELYGTSAVAAKRRQQIAAVKLAVAASRLTILPFLLLGLTPKAMCCHRFATTKQDDSPLSLALQATITCRNLHRGLKPTDTFMRSLRDQFGTVERLAAGVPDRYQSWETRRQRP
jgi:hypothetical protein